MTQSTKQPLDRVFHALSDPTRRKILRTLSRGDYRVTDLARPHDMSLAAVSKHIKTLEAAGLITRYRDGSAHYVQLRTTSLQKASRWIDFYRDSWSPQLEKLESMLEEATPPRHSARNP